MPNRQQLEELLAGDPEDIFLNFGLAMELAKDEPIEPALRQFDKVIGLDAGYIAAYYHKGRLLLGVDRKDEARETLTAGAEAAQRAGDAHAETEMRDLLKLAC